MKCVLFNFFEFLQDASLDIENESNFSPLFDIVTIIQHLCPLFDIFAAFSLYNTHLLL